jgi:hypothetical protein
VKRLVAAVVMAMLVTGCFGAVPPTPSAATPTPPPAPPTPTVAPTTEPGVPLAMAIQIRAAFGFRADAVWVTTVSADAGSILSNVGIRMTADEVAQLQKQQSFPDDRSALIAYGMRHADQYGGLFIDRATGGTVMLFTADLDRHRDAIAALRRGAIIDVRQCTYTEADLMSVMESIDRNELLAEGIDLMTVGLNTDQNIVVIEAKSNAPDAKARLEARYGGRVVANIFPVPGAWSHRPVGDGWRLVSAIQRGPNWAYTVRVATNQAEWSALWAELSPGLEEPAIDDASEIAVVFAEGNGGPGNCDEVRLDDVVIDVSTRLVFSRTSDPLAPRNCDAMLGGSAVFVVALSRAALPPTPFDVQLHEQPTGPETDRITVDSL